MNEITAEKYAQSATELEKSSEVLSQVFEKCLFTRYFLEIFICFWLMWKF